MEKWEKKGKKNLSVSFKIDSFVGFFRGFLLNEWKTGQKGLCGKTKNRSCLMSLHGFLLERKEEALWLNVLKIGG